MQLKFTLLSYRYIRIFFITNLLAIAITNAIAREPVVFVQPIGTIIQEWNPVVVNQYLAKWDSNIIPGVTDPFDTHYGVSEVQPTKAMYFVRAYTEPNSGPLGSFIVRASVVRGLTPQQIRNVLALPDIPTKIVYVKVPAGAQYGLWTGIAAPIMSPGHEWGFGGGEQTKIIGKETNPNPPADPARFANYSRLPADSYMNPALIGYKALSYSQSVSSGAAGKVAAYLDRHIPQPYSDMEDVYTTLDFINADGPPELAVALKQISPVNFDSYNTVLFRNELLFDNIVFEQTQAGHRNTNLKDPKFETSILQTNRKCFDSWLTIAGEQGEQTESSKRVGFSYQTGALIGGADCQILSNIKIGASAGYFRDHLGWNESAGSAEINNAKLGIYSNYSVSDYFFNSLLTGGFSWSSAQRNMNFSGNGVAVLSGLVVDTLSVEREAESNQTGQNVGLNFVGGKNFQFNEWNLMPSAQLTYFYSGINSFHESGAEDLDLKIQNLTAQTIRTQLGLLLGKQFCLKQGLLRTDFQLAWAHNFPVGNRVITSSLPSLGGQFNINGFKEQTNELLAYVNLTAKATKKFWIDTQYNADLSHGFNSQALSIVFKYYLDA